MKHKKKHKNATIYHHTSRSVNHHHHDEPTQDAIHSSRRHPAQPLPSTVRVDLKCVCRGAGAVSG
jgi:hypothetical protein